MEAVRKRIFQNVIATLEQIASINTVTFGSYLPEKKKMPMVGIMPMDEQREMVTHEGACEERLGFIARAVVDESFEHAGLELETILAAVERAVLDDPSRGGLAMTTEKRATRWLFLDQQFPQAGADIDFLVTYLRSENNPDV